MTIAQRIIVIHAIIMAVAMTAHLAASAEPTIISDDAGADIFRPS